MNEFSFGAVESPKDKRTIKVKSLVLSGEPLISGGIDYLQGDIENQNRVGICTAISMTQHQAKADGRKYSADFQYLIQKKFFDGNWNEGSSIFHALKVAYNVGFLPEEHWTYTTQKDRMGTYADYIAKLQAVPDAQIERLKALCVNKIPGYAQSDVKDPQDIARGILASRFGLVCMYWVGKEWYTDVNGNTTYDYAKISPIRPPAKVICGHAITMSKFDYSQYMKQTLVNTWGLLWGDKGKADVNHDNYKPREAWLITPGSVIKKFNTDLGFGMNGPEVINLQNALKIKGFFNWNSTGYFGFITKAAVKNFQKSQGIIATGFCGPLTRAALNKLF